MILYFIIIIKKIKRIIKIFKYTDLLNNNYSQEIFVNLELLNTYKSQFGGFDFKIIKVDVNKPVRINDTSTK